MTQGFQTIQPESAANGRERAAANLMALTPKQEATALALAAGRTIEQAAREAGAGERTVRTWMHTLPAFNRRVAELRAEMTGRAAGRLVEQMTSAAETLGFLSRKAKSQTVRLSAARAVLELGVKLSETVELEQRIAALESQRQAPRRTA